MPTAAELDEQRITLYLPPSVLDRAEAQAVEAGVSTVQVYCANLLREAIETADTRGRVAGAEARQGTMPGFRAIEDDPEYLAEWSATVAPVAPAPEIQVIEAPAPSPSPTMPDPSPSPAAQVVFRHANAGTDDLNSFLPRAPSRRATLPGGGRRTPRRNSIPGGRISRGLIY